jgi:hypothetical protein
VDKHQNRFLDLAPIRDRRHRSIRKDPRYDDRTSISLVARRASSLRSHQSTIDRGIFGEYQVSRVRRGREQLLSGRATSDYWSDPISSSRLGVKLVLSFGRGAPKVTSTPTSTYIVNGPLLGRGINHRQATPCRQPPTSRVRT